MTSTETEIPFPDDAPADACLYCGVRSDVPNYCSPECEEAVFPDFD